jgi:TRAP-type C4-dicarboxylate transport system permease small subunit
MGKRLERILGFSATISGFIGQYAALAMVLVIVIGVTFRYVLKLPLRFDAEYTGYLLVMVSWVGAAYALKAGAHVRVDVVVRHLPPRLRAWMQVGTDVLSLLCMSLLLYYMWQLAYSNLVRGVFAMTPMMTPLGPIQMLLPLGALLFILQLLIELSRSMRTATSPAQESGPEK